MDKARTREELKVMVSRLLERRYSSEAERDELLLAVKESVPHPRVSDLIYYSEVELSADEIVEIALSYRPIVLPG